LEGDELDKARRSVRDKDLAAAVILPDGYSEQILAGQDVQLAVVVDLSSQAGQTASSAVQAAATRLLGAVQTAHISAEAYRTRASFGSDAARQVYVDEALALASEAWQRPPLTVSVERSGASAQETEGVFNAYGQASPGMMVQFAVFGLLTAAQVLVLERRSGALQRLLTTPTSRVEIIAGHVLAMFAITFVQLTILIFVGQVAFGLDYMREPLAILLMMAVLAFWAASLGLLVGAQAKTEEQVIVFSMLAMFLFSALGGAWFPLDITGQAFSTIGHLTPTAWAMDGFQNIIVRGLGLNSVLLPAGILLAYAVAFFALAVWRFKFE
jgi:ABC-2 type transport system permease protein